MGSDHLKLERQADRRLERIQHEQERRSTMNGQTTERHGDAAAQAAIEGAAPIGRSSLHGLTWRREPKAAPLPTVPLPKHAPARIRPVAPPSPVNLTPASGGTLGKIDGTALARGLAVAAPGSRIEPGTIAPVAGGPALVAWFRSKHHAELRLAVDPHRVVAWTRGGRLMADARELLESQQPILAAAVGGAPAECGVTAKHPAGIDTSGVWCLDGGVVACQWCLDGGAS